MNKTDNKVAAWFNSLDEKIKATAKELFAEIKMADEPTDAPAPTFTEVPMADGTVLKVGGELVAGSELILVTPEGEIPAPEGDLTLADGSIIVAKKEGEKTVIAEVKPAEEMKKEGEQAPVNMEAIEKAIGDKFASKFSSLESEIVKLKAENDALKLKVSKGAAQLVKTVEVLEAFASVPTAAPIVTPNTINKKDKMFETIFSKK